MSKTFRYPLLLLILLYLGVHASSMADLSRIDYFYTFILAIGFLGLLFLPRLHSSTLRIIVYNFCITITFILILELGFYLHIFNHLAITPITIKFNTQNREVEQLNASPYFKFFPNTQISSIGNRGEDFVYTWITDSLGFKNLKNELQNNKYNYLALGDSMTEGMGVKVEDTWPSIISSSSDKRVYNAGVQGYAASQFLGTLNYLNNKIYFEGVIVGHLPTIFSREKNFISLPTKATGGIESIRMNKSGRGVVVTQILKLTSLKIQSLIRPQVRPQDFKFANTKFSFYAREIKNPNQLSTRTSLKNDMYWRNLVNSYREIAKFCYKNNKKVIIVAFPHRAETYFSADEQELNDIKSTQYYVEFELLKEELSGLGIEFIDTYPAISSYSKGASIDKLPYLNLDGHFSKYGNQILAKTIMPFL